MACLLRGNLLEENVILNCGDYKWHVFPAATADHVFLESSLSFCASSGRARGSSDTPIRNEAGGWTSSSPTPQQSHLWRLQFRWRSLFPPLVSGGRRKERWYGGSKRHRSGSVLLDPRGTELSSSSPPTALRRWSRGLLGPKENSIPGEISGSQIKALFRLIIGFV